MYVIPFWSYRETGDDVIVKNWLTDYSEPMPRRVVDALEAVHQGADPAPGDADLLARSRDAGVLMESFDAAEAAYAGIESAWGRTPLRVDQIELTNRCPYTCKMCPRTHSMTRSLGNMNLQLFERIVDQVAGRQDYLALHHFGESLVHPGLPSAVAFAASRGVRSGLSCNPPSLQPHLGQKLLAAGLANVVLSFDSLDPDTYRDIRGRAADFARGDRNIREFIQARNAGGHGTFVTLQMINMRCNASEAAAFIEYCCEVQVDYGVVIRLGRWDFDDDRVASLGESQAAGYNGFCSRPWTSVAVLWDGRVVPCCHDYNGEVVLGDLNTATFDEIAASENSVAFRRRSNSTPLCRKCVYSRWSREQQRAREGFRAFHRDRSAIGLRREWINPSSPAAVDGRLLFNGFDVLLA